MRLKRLEIFGFKSFADKTVLTFKHGLTGIVGPNGCGKSNVVDAIKWVLGEQSAKSLRGGQMSDVVFGGTSKRKAMGFAEVALTFSHVKGVLSQHADEVTIRRRAYSTGESEYYIDDNPARLRDIRDMFLDTGIGKGAYSIIEQGRVAALLQANPKERRAVLEEAAGISRYRQRRKETNQKLERTQQKLEIVATTIGEREKRLRSVRYQASRARKYKELQEQLAEKRIIASMIEYDEYHRKLLEVHAAIEAGDMRERELSTHHAQLSATLTELETANDAVSRKRAEISERLGSLRSSLSGTESDVSHTRVRISEITREHALANDRSVRLQESIKEMRAELETTHTAREQAAKEAVELEGKVKEIELKLEAVQSSLNTLREKAHAMKNTQITAAEHRMDIENRLSEVTEKCRHLDLQFERRAARHNQMGESIEEAQFEFEELGEAHKTATSRLEKTTNEMNSLKQENARQTQSVDSMNSAMSRITSDVSSRESRLSMLEQLEKQQQGMTKGVRGILDALNSGTRLDGVCGVVADLISMEEGVAVAIETALGGAVQNIITERATDAKQAIEFLKRTRKGRATFLPLDRIRPRTRVNSSLMHEQGVLGVAVDLIEFDARYSDVMDNLLAGTLVVETMDDAVRLGGSTGRGVRMVTLDGELIHPTGAMAGGRESGERLGVLSRKAEIDRLSAELAEARQKLQQAENDLIDLRRGMTKSSKDIESLSYALSERQREGAAAEAELKSAQRRIDEIKEESSTIEEELKLAEQERATAKGEYESLSQEAKALRESGDENEGSADELEIQMRELSQKDSEFRTTLAEAKAEVVASIERSSVEGRAGERMHRDIEEREMERNGLVSTLNEMSERKEELEINLKEKTAELEVLVQKNMDVDSEIEGLSENESSTHGDLTRVRMEERELRSNLEETQQGLNELRLSENEYKVRADTVVEKVLREDNKNLIEEHKGFDIEGIDVKEVRREWTEIERKCRSYEGTVNMNAIAEQEELEGELETIQSQYKDLVDARTKLREIIDHLDLVSREKFAETFEAVRENFSQFFRKAFGGGSADMHLEEGVEDVLEAGIEIIAKPPNKEPRRLSLLSGGEQAMTTIALIMAIFKAHPSPFCILDEVDAPLDESNIDRFMVLVKDFMEDTQFIMISHSRRSISYADQIYGITMQEPGVSRRLKMSFEEVEHNSEFTSETQEEEFSQSVEAG